MAKQSLRLLPAGEFEYVGKAVSLRPGATNTLYLDEITRKLANIERLLEEEAPQGRVIPQELTLTNDEEELEIRAIAARPVFSALIINDGPGGIYYGVNRDPPLAQIKSGESEKIDFARPRLSYLTIKAVGTATTRIRLVF